MIELTDRVRELVEAVHGRARPYTTVVLAQVVAHYRDPAARRGPEQVVTWVAKVKVGRAIVAKCCQYSHYTPEDALEALVASTRKALGIRS